MIRLPRWREYYNPLHGLTMARLVAMEDAADRGQHADVQPGTPKPEGAKAAGSLPATRLRLSYAGASMETADVTVQAAIARRLSFLDTLAWEVRTTEGADPALAQEQAELLRYAYNGLRGDLAPVQPQRERHNGSMDKLRLPRCCFQYDRGSR